MNSKNSKNGAAGALAFWLILIAVALVPLLWLQVWAFQNLNMKAFVAGNIFIIFIILTFAFDFNKNLYPKKSSFSQNSLSFILGIIFGSLLGMLTNLNASIFAVFSVSQQYLLSEVSSQLPLFWSVFTNTIGAPVAEEMLFLISIPAIIFAIIVYVGARYKIFSNPLLQVLIVAAVVSPLFAFFHVGNLALTGFIISAMLFRTLAILFVYGDEKSNIVPVLAIIPAFGVGYHLANNVMSVGGWLFFVNTMMLEPFGFVVLFALAIFFLSGVWAIISKLVNKREESK